MVTKCHNPVIEVLRQPKRQASGQIGGHRGGGLTLGHRNLAYPAVDPSRAAAHSGGMLRGFFLLALLVAAANLLLCAVLHRWLRKMGAALFAAL